jgi:hypothetical protein
MSVRFYIRSASDKTDAWPHWFVADSYQGGLNVTQTLRKLRGDDPCETVIMKDPGLRGILEMAFSLQPFMSDYDSLKLCRWANETLGGAPMAMWAERARTAA